MGIAVKITNRATLMSLTDEVKTLLLAHLRLLMEGRSNSPEGRAGYTAMRSALARYRSYRAEHFGLAAAYRGPWSRLRVQVLAEEPACRTCGVRSTVVDHILPVALGGSPRSRSNLQALCKRCHSLKTAGESLRLVEASWVIDPLLAPPSGEGLGSQVLARLG